MVRKFKLFCFFFSTIAIIVGGVWLVISTVYPKLPNREEPIIIYSNQCRSDLRRVVINALKGAEQSIHLVMFGLSDSSVISELQKKSKIVEMQIFYDKRSSQKLQIPNVAHSMKISGLMHQKVLVIDDTLSFIGSTNFTRSSLSMHDNMLIGILSKEVARFLKEKTPLKAGHFTNNDLEIWLLPDKEREAKRAILKILSSAKYKITISMFTLTHPAFLEELIKAKRRGVEVNVFLDYKSFLGSCNKAAERLKEGGIRVNLNGGLQLFHHKYAYIDDSILITGSANWTRAAFKKNRDLFLILYNLTSSQKKLLAKLERICAIESR